MNQKYLAMFVLTGFAISATPVFAEDAGQNEPIRVDSGPNFQQTPTDSSKPTNKNSAIQGTNASGEKQMTVIDAGGNLKMVAPSQPITSSGGSSIGNNFPPKTTGPTGSQNIAPTNKPGQLNVTPNPTLPPKPTQMPAQSGQAPMMPGGAPQGTGQAPMMPSGGPQGTQPMQPGQAPMMPSGGPQGTQPMQPGQAPMMPSGPQGKEPMQPGQAPMMPGAPQGAQPMQPGQAPMSGAPQGTPMQPGEAPMPGAPQGTQPLQPSPTPIAPGTMPEPMPGQAVPPTSGQTSQMMPHGPKQQMEISNSSATMAGRAFVR